MNKMSLSPPWLFDITQQVQILVNQLVPKS